MGAERRKMHEGNCGENEEYPSVRDGCNDKSAMKEADIPKMEALAEEILGE